MPKFPVCGACNKPFDSENRKPLLLPCGDAFCKACLSSREDEDKTFCPLKKCRCSWGASSLSDLQMVYALIPDDTTTVSEERQVTPGPREGTKGRQRDVVPAPNRRPARPPTGREVVPLDDSDSVSSISSASSMSSASSISSGSRKGVSGSSFPTCVVCTGDFNKNENRPLLLKCSHVVCLMCLELLERQEKLSCPYCRQPFERGTLQKLPVVKTLIHHNNANKRSSAPPLSPQEMDDKVKELQQEYERRESFSSGSKTIELYVRDLRGQTHTVHVNPHTETVLRLRQRLRSAPDCSRYLTYEGQTMQDECCLSSYNVRPFNTIREQARLVGGK